MNHVTLAVTLCEEAENRCPITPPHVKCLHLGFDDPARAVETEPKVWEVFQRVCDEIGARIKRFEKMGE